MTDVNPAVNPLFLREDDLRRGMEMLYYAQRGLAEDCAPILDRHGLGRAHHRVLYFLRRYPRLPVGDLLAILKVTKQTLSRVLADLTAAGLVEQRRGVRDRRQKILSLTDAGAALERELYEVQRRRLTRAYRRAGAEAVEGFRRVMAGLIDEPERRRLADGDDPPPRR